MTTPEYEVFVPVKGELHLTQRLVGYLRATEHGRVHVYDNDSPDGTWFWLLGQPDLCPHSWPGDNYYGMWNDAWKTAKAPYLAYLNNDLHFGPEFLPAMAKGLDEHPEWGAVWPLRVGNTRITGSFGAAFMVRRSIPMRFNESYRIYFGDTQFYRDVADTMPVGHVGSCEHDTSATLAHYPDLLKVGNTTDAEIYRSLGY